MTSSHSDNAGRDATADFRIMAVPVSVKESWIENITSSMDWGMQIIVPYAINHLPVITMLMTKIFFYTFFCTIHGIIQDTHWTIIIFPIYTKH
jgi:hypothetical protein